METFCVICKNLIPDKRAYRGSHFCSNECHRQYRIARRRWKAEFHCRLCGRPKKRKQATGQIKQCESKQPVCAVRTDEVNAMSDDELSAACAERWMGYRWIAANKNDKCALFSAEDAAWQVERQCHYSDGKGERFEDWNKNVPPFASDPHAALDLLLRMQSQAGVSYQVISVRHSDDDSYVMCSISIGDDRSPNYVQGIDNRTLARAIAEAAMMVERGESVEQ